MYSSAVVPHILLVDDDEIMREVWPHLLAPMGFEFMTAPGAREALASAKLAIPDLIITDMMMPGMTGIELFMALQHEDALKAVPVIFMTSGTFPSNRPAADCWLHKDISPDALAAKIHRLLLAQ